MIRTNDINSAIRSLELMSKCSLYRYLPKRVRLEKTTKYIYYEIVERGYENSKPEDGFKVQRLILDELGNTKWKDI